MVGDMDCDGVLTRADIDGLIRYLADPDAYGAQYPGCHGEWAGDVNQDIFIDFDDLVELSNVIRAPLRRPAPAIGN